LADSPSPRRAAQGVELFIELLQRLAEHNFALARRHFSYTVTEGQLRGY